MCGSKVCTDFSAFGTVCRDLCTPNHLVLHRQYSNDKDEDKNKVAVDNEVVKGLIDSEHALHMTIAYFYIVVYNCMYPVDWKSNNLLTVPDSSKRS